MLITPNFYIKLKNKKLSNMMLPLFITLGAILTAGGGWIQWTSDNKNRIANDSLNTQNKKLLTEIAELSKESNNNSIKSQEELRNVNHKLFQSQEIINEFRLETINTITGGNNMPIVIVTIMEDLSEKYFTVNFTVLNKGKYPLKNIELIMHDRYGSITKVMSQTSDGKGIEGQYLYDNTIRQILDESKSNVGDLLPYRIKTLYDSKFIHALKYVTYDFTIQWENGIYQGVIAGNQDENKHFIVTVSKAWNNNGRLKDVIQINEVHYDK